MFIMRLHVVLKYHNNADLFVKCLCFEIADIFLGKIMTSFRRRSSDLEFVCTRVL